MTTDQRPDPLNLGLLGGDLIASILNQDDQSTGLLDLIEGMGGTQSLGTPEESLFEERSAAKSSSSSPGIPDLSLPASGRQSFQPLLQTAIQDPESDQPSVQIAPQETDTARQSTSAESQESEANLFTTQSSVDPLTGSANFAQVNEAEFDVHLTFDTVTGAVVEDQSPNGISNNGTLENGAQIVESESFLDGIVSFNDNTQAVSLEDSSDINLGSHAKRTLGIWFRVNEFRTDGTKQVIYEEGAGARGLSIYLDANRLYVGGWNQPESNWTGTFLSTDAIQENTWHHVSLVLDAEADLTQTQADVFSAYLDGEQFGIGAGSQLWEHSSDIAIGGVRQGVRFHDGSSSLNTFSLNGDIGDFRLYNRALSSTEISDLATPPQPPIEDPVVLDDAIVHLSLNETTGLYAADSQLNDGDQGATLQNGAAFEPGFSGGGVSLDGIDDYLSIADSDLINLSEHPKRSIGVWFKLDELSSDGRKQVIYEEGGGGRGLNLYVEDNQLYVGGWNISESNWRGTFLSTDGISADTWHHVTLVLDATPGLAEVQQNVLSGYLDGVLFGSGEGSQLWPHASDIGLGAINQDARFHDGTVLGRGTNAFAGVIADFQLYNRALTTADVELLATRPGIPNEPPELFVVLGDDTGISETDQITRDPSIAGRIEHFRVGMQVQASLNNQSIIDISDQVSPNGDFNLSELELESLLGSSLIDGEYQLLIEVVDGATIIPSTLTFTLDRSSPTLTLDSPLVNGTHGLQSRLVGTTLDGSEIVSTTYQLDEGLEESITLTGEGRFNVPFDLNEGLHQLQVKTIDAAGNETAQELEFSTSPGITSVSPIGSQGWSGTTATSAVLGEGNSLVNEAVLPVTLGQEEGTRTLSFNLQTFFDISDSEGLLDRLSVYLVDEAGETLVDMGIAGTPVFAISESGAEFQAGTVSYNGTTVEIDVSAVEANTNAQLVFQLLNGDRDTNTVVRVDQLSNRLDPDGIQNPAFPIARTVVAAGVATDINTLTPSDDLVARLQRVRFDTSTGTYRADLSVTNTGEITVGRQIAVSLIDLPEGVTVEGASSVDNAGNPYFNFRPAIQAGGLEPGASSAVIELVIENPNFVPLNWNMEILSGGANQAPVFESIPTLTITPGAPFEYELSATDPDGDPIQYSLRNVDTLPTGGLTGNGRLSFQARPDQVGTYTVEIVASDGQLETVQSVTLQVIADQLSTTRISGVVQTVELQPLAGVVVALDGYEVMTAADGSFLIEVPEGVTLSPDALLVIRAGDLVGEQTYPTVAEPLPLLLGNEAFTGVNNVIERPIYLPALDTSSAQMIDPGAQTETTVEVNIFPNSEEPIPPAQVSVPPGSLMTMSEDGTMEAFSGNLSITEVPVALTPAALPPGLSPDVVVTIQPGEMIFLEPAALSLPNLSGFGPGTQMDLWSINPATGEFDQVGLGQVSADGSMVETVDGGINNSSWHFFSPVPIEARVRDGDLGCRTCPKAIRPLSSDVELDSGAVIETHNLVTYESLGVSRGVQLRYDSLRADPRPIVQFGYDDVNPTALAPGFTDKLRLLADLTIHTGEYDYQVPGFEGGQYGLTGGEHFWSINNQIGPVNAALQADLRDLASGVYDYSLNSGIRLFVREQVVGTSTQTKGKIVHIDRRDSAFGSGWGIAGVQELVENSDGSVLLIDGDGSELLFDPPTDGVYGAPAGDFSTLEKLPDGTFRRTMKDQMVYQFDDQNRLISVTDRNGNQTQHVYEGDLLVKFVDPVGLETTFGYTNGKVTSITDPASRVTELKYDAAGNLQEIIDPDLTSRVFEYDAGHHMTAETDKRQHREQTVYNFAGRATHGIQKDGSVIQVEAAQLLGLFEVERTASPFGSPFAASRELGTSTYADQDGKVSTTNLDEAGQTVTSRDGVGKLGAIVRDERNLVMQSTDARGFDDFYTYDDQGNILSIQEEILSPTRIENQKFSLQFDGIDDQVTGSLLTNVQDTFTLEFWVNPTQERSLTSELDSGISGTRDQRYAIAPLHGTFFVGNGFAGAGVSVGTNGISVFEHAESYLPSLLVYEGELSGWNHIAVVYKDKKPSLYINGEFIKSGLRSNYTVLPSTQLGDVGEYGFYQGQLDEYRIWNAARSVAEIQTDMNRRIQGVEPNLVGYWSFEEGAGNITVDQTSNNDSGTVIGDIIWSNDTPQLLSEVIYNEDFENEIGEEWTSSILNNTHPEILTQFSGRYSRQDQSLTIPTEIGRRYLLKFDLYTLGSWDGGSTSFLWGPDYFNVEVSNQSVFRETFSTRAIPQSFPGVGEGVSVFGSSNNRLYREIPLLFTATDSNTVIRFFDTAVTRGLDDESWGIDNIEISQVLFAETQFLEQSFTYDTVFNQVTNRTDELGRRIIYEIDPTNGNTLSETRVIGEFGDNDPDQITRYTYTPAGQIDRITDPLGRVTDYDYNSLGRLTKITFAQGTDDEATQQFGYDDAGNQTLFIDENGNETQFKYDPLNRLEEITEADPDGDGPLTSPVTIFTYDDNGNLKSVQNARGHLTKYEYDEQDRQTLMTDALRGEMRYDYDNFGNIIAETDERGYVTHYRYDARNRLIETVDPEGAIVQYGYDLDNNLTLVREYISDTEFRDTRYRYDSRNRLIRETDTLGETTVYEYDAVNNLTAVIDRRNHRTEYRYDDLDRLIETKDALEQIASRDYNLANNLIATTDERSHTTNYRYDARDRLTQVLHPAPFENESLTYSYDDVGNLRFVTDELDRVTEYVYDALNRQVEMIDPREHKTAYGYDANGNLTRVTDALLQTTSYEYDALNRQRVRTDDLGETQITGYDAASNITSFTDELKRTTTFSYDGRNLRTQVTDPLKHTVTTTYDALRRVTSEKNHLGHTTSYLYDLLDRVTEVSDATGKATQYEYDPVGNLTALIDAENNRTSYVYDELNRVQEETTTFGTRFYGYDEVGNQTRITDRNGRVRTFDYDERDRLTLESWLDGTGASIHDVDYTYNAASELTRVSDAFSQYAYQYNPNGFVTQVDNLGTPNLPNVVFDYRYNAVNNLESVTDRWNGQTQGIEEYRYDPLNRVSRITQSGTNVSDKRVDFVYDAASQMETVSRYSGLDTTNLVVQSDYGFDAAGRLESLVHERAGNAIAFYNWQYDAANRITRVESIDGVSNYTYNDRDELTASDHSYQADEAYTYDGTGNRTNAGYQTGQHNRLLNDGTYSYVYDNEGNRIIRTAIASGTVDEYTWDYRNRLTAIVTKDADGNVIKTAEYTYDVYDRRIEKVVDSDGDGAAAPETERYIYDGDHIALVFDGEGNQTHRYLHGPQIDQVLAEETADRIVRWAFADNQGTVRDVITEGESDPLHITYDSFGQITNSTEATAYFRFGYTGREFDQESGQYFYRARYFDPSTGRFINEDTIGFRGGDTNLYRYVGNSPSNFIDPTGNYIESAWDALSLTVGVASFADNVRRGDWGNAALDGLGIAADGLAVALPVVPGGVGAARNTSRVASFVNRSKSVKRASDFVRANKWAKNGIRGVQGLNLGVNLGQTGVSAWDTYRQWQESCNGEIPWAGIARTGLNGLGVLGSAGTFKRALDAPCFVAGTLVLTTKGKKAIDELRPGDWVLSWDEETGEISARAVTEYYQREVSSVFDIFIGIEKISCSTEHPFWVEGKGWVLAHQLMKGDVLKNRDGESLVIDEIHHRDEVTQVFNVEIDGSHTYFVSKSEILSHNMCGFAQSSFQFEKLKADLAQQELLEAIPTGSALKGSTPFSPRTFGGKIDLSHASPTFARDLVKDGRHFTIKGADGINRNLTQVPGEVNGEKGIFEFIVDPSKGLTHERFIKGGVVTGYPNQSIK